MSESELLKLLKKNSSGGNKTISTEAGLQAVLLALADSDIETDWALAGGIAMHLYGFLRATTDVDVIANGKLSLDRQKFLSFGGESYAVIVEGQKISVDWIVRDDELADFYLTALADALTLENGIRIITPEWLLILKHFSGRAKDEIDLIWLLQQENLVNREQVNRNLIKVLGERAGLIVAREFQSHFDYADVLKMREQGKYSL